MLRERNQSLLLLQRFSQLLSKSITNKLAIDNTMDTQLKNQIFIDVFLIEDYEYAAQRKELLITTFGERFKATTLGKSHR